MVILTKVDPMQRMLATPQGWIGCICLAMIIALAAVWPPTNASDGEFEKSEPVELHEAIERMTALIAEKQRTSLTFRVRGRLGGYDFGHPPMSWSMSQRLRTNPASRDLRTLVFHAVCRENSRALQFLFAVNNDVSGGFFSAAEADYLDWIAQRSGIDLNFRDAYRRDRGPPPDDMRSINHRRRVAAALAADQPGEALRSLVGFAQLCSPR